MTIGSKGDRQNSTQDDGKGGRGGQSSRRGGGRGGGGRGKIVSYSYLFVIRGAIRQSEKLYF